MLACLPEVSANFVNTATRQLIFAEAKGERLAGGNKCRIKANASVLTCHHGRLSRNMANEPSGC